MSKQPTPKADQTRALREAKFASRRQRMTLADVTTKMADAVDRSKASAEKASAKKKARHARD